MSNPSSVYRRLVARTLSSLFREMKSDCEARGAKLAVIGLPCRAQLSPNAGLERSFAGLDYSDELNIVGEICHDDGIGFADVETSAEDLPPASRDALFYVVHLAPAGHEFIADTIEPFIRSQLLSAPRR